MFIIYIIALFIAPQLWLEPFIGLRTDYIIYPLWIFILVLRGNINLLFKFNSQDYIYLLLIFWFALSMAINDKNAFSQTFLVDYIKWFFLYRMVVASIESIDQLKEVVNKLLFVISIIAIEAIQHKYFSVDGIGWAGQTLGWVDSSVTRSGGTGRTQWVNIFDGPGTFCVMFTLALPFAIRLFDSDRLIMKFTGLMLVLLLLLAIWSTGSRGGFLTTIAVLSVYLMAKMGVSFVRVSKIAAIAIALFMLAPSHLTSVRDENRSAQHRVDMWIEGVEMVEQNPVFGIGKGNYSHYTGRLIAHNSTIEIMGELGLTGLFLWLSLMFISYKKVFCYVNNTEDINHKFIVMAIGVSLLSYHVSSMFITLEYETLYFMLGLTRSIDNFSGQDVKYTDKNILLVAMASIGFYLFLKLFVNIYY